MLTFWKTIERIGPAVRRRGGQLLLVPVLLLCVWLMTDSAYAVEPELPTYLFEVATGVRSQNGTEDQIDFFIITYTTQSSGQKTVSKVLFPSKDGWKKTFETVSAIDDTQAKLDGAFEEKFGYMLAPLNDDKKIFQSYSTDQYLFTTEEPITEIKRVQFFAGGNGSWNCRSMRIFHVTDLVGLYRSNPGANDCFIDFEGDLMAEGTMQMDLSIPWNNDRLISTKNESDSKRSSDDISLKTTDFDPARAHHAKRKGDQKTIILRFDFADIYGGGLEAEGAMSAKNNKLLNMGLAETMSVTAYYKDIYGMEHAVTVPAVLNAAEYTADLLGDDKDKPIAGFAQQGESMVLGIYMPEFASLVPEKGITVTLGAKQVMAQLGMTAVGGKPDGPTAQQRTSRIGLSETDTANITAMAIYDPNSKSESGESVQVSASVNESSGAIEYIFRGSPLYYQPVTAVSGNVLRIGANPLSLAEYKDGTGLKPRDMTERYLIELSTDTAEGSGTKDDIMMSISWTDLEGTPKTATDLNVRELARDYNGWWYGSMPQDMGYYHGVATGQTLRFFVPLQRVKTITDVKVWMSQSGTHDDWQMKDLAIKTVPNNSYGKRIAAWEDFSVDGITDSIHFDRDVNDMMEVFRYSEYTELVALIQQGSDDYTNVGPSIGSDGEGAEVMAAKMIDWSKYRYSMTFKEASQELGFGKQRYTYAVTVHVAGNSSATLEDGDCGSHNLFYFRLVFKNGNSSYVLANQQLPSDGFIAGASQTFYIATNQDYGDVTAVQIIPDDVSDDADQFDKLNIQSIDIKRESKAALVPVWTVSSVGWISIDYRDEGQMQSVTGMAGRGASDMVRSYEVDGSTFEMNFMLAITTEGYPKGGSQFVGNLSATVHYESYSPTGGLAQLGDVTKNMYAYMNRTAMTSDDVGGRTISDPELMFRPNHTDRFYFSLSDVRSIKYIDLEAIAKESTTWYISDVSLFIVNGEGTLLRNSKGEYQRVYKKGEELKKIQWGTNETSYGAIVNPYDPDINKQPQPTTIYFTDYTIEVSPDAKQWKSIVNRTPPSENDTLNIFLFPEKGRADTANGLVTAVGYSTTSETEEQVSTGTMKAVMYNDQEVFFATGISASKFKALTNVTVSAARNGTGIQNGSVDAIIQRVRSGVVMNTWEMGNKGSTGEFGLALTPNTATTTTRRQHIQLQLGADTQRAVLEQNVNDLAVAFYFRGDDPSGMDLRTPYVYLTDLKTEGDDTLRTLYQTYTQIRPGQVIDLTFEQPNIKEITGVALVSMGEISATVESVHIEDNLIALTNGLDPERLLGTVGVYDSTDALTVTNVPNRMNIGAQQIVKPLSLQFVTAETAASKVSTGTNGPVRMKLGYFDQGNNLIEKIYEDVRPYISDNSTGFASGSTVNLEMLVPDITSLRWIELEPYSATTSAAADETAPSAMWTLASVSMNLNNGEQEGNFSVNRQIVEGTPLRTFVAKVSVTADAKTSGDNKTQVIDDENNDLLIASGESIEIGPRVIGSPDGFTAVLVKVDTTTGATGRASLDDTRGYTAESIAANANAATDSRVAAAWREAKPEVGSFEFDKTKIKFTPPRNYTDKSVQYEIRVISNENESAVLPIRVTVENESDPVAKKLDDIAKTPVQATDSGGSESGVTPIVQDPSPGGESGPETGAGE